MFVKKFSTPLKYHNQITVRDGIRFHSKKEADRWGELLWLEKGKEIQFLKRQVKFRFEVGEIYICSLVVDFTYEEDGKKIAEDSKGYETALFKLKAKLFEALFPHWELRLT